MDWPTIAARWDLDRGGRTVVWVVLHSMETPCTPGVAASVGRYFATVGRKASTHVGADPAGVVRYVADGRGCYGAERRSNRCGWHVEQAGRAQWSRAQWLAPDPLAMIGRAAQAVAYACARWAIPPRMLTDAEVTAGAAGITTHAQLSRVFAVSGGHWDPGPGYPVDVLLDKVRRLLDQPPLVPVADPDRGDNRFRGFPLVRAGSRDEPGRVAAGRADPRLTDPGMPVLSLQTWLNVTTDAKLYGDGVYAALTEAAVRHFQWWWRGHGVDIEVDGVCGEQTWSQLDAVADVQGR